jgi:hypothetical protein
MQDVTAIIVTLATIDPKSRILLNNCQLSGSDACGSYTDNGLIQRLKDFDPAQPIYDLTTSWQSTLNSITDMPRSALAGVRIYQRYFYLTPLK